MAIERKFCPIIVTAALLVVAMGCGSSASSDGQSGQPAAAVSESGKVKKIPATLNSGAKLTGAERGAIMSAKGHGDP